MPPVQRLLRRLASNRLLATGALALLALLALAWIVPAVRPAPNLANVEHGLSESGAPLPPSLASPLGTDDLGRDELSRVAHAARASLLTAGVATAIALAIGLIVGLLAGLTGGWLDAIVQRMIELAISFPVLLLAIFAAAALRAAELDRAPGSYALVLGLMCWPATARIVRSRALVLARAEFIVAARGLGASRWRVLLRHVVPNVSGVLAVMLTLTAAQILVADSTMSFAGLGAAPPEASWGRMVFEGRIYYRSAPWLMIAPGLALVVAVAAFHLVGAGLRRELERASP
jgi:peptide/nickel transport system permease protein